MKPCCVAVRACAFYNVFVLYCIRLQNFSVSQLTSGVDFSPGCVLALPATLTQQNDFEIYGCAGVSGVPALFERAPCVFVTLSYRILPNT